MRLALGLVISARRKRKINQISNKIIEKYRQGIIMFLLARESTTTKCLGQFDPSTNNEVSYDFSNY
jgi:hypothetical protein